MIKNIKQQQQQSKIESWIEVCVNVGSGFILALLLWSYVIQPLYDANIMTSALIITLSFTVLSIARGYLWRRFFARGFHKQVHYAVSSYFQRRK